MKKIILEIYGIRFEVYANAEAVLESLKKDFVLYLRGDKGIDAFKTIIISIFKDRLPYHKVPPCAASLYNLNSICYKNNHTHYIDYAGNGLMIYDFKEEKAEIYSEDENLLYEKTRLVILSRMGELLDHRHIHRVHAAGLAKNGIGTLCLLPMAAGKTTIALNVLKRDKEIKLISDDICMIDFSGHIYPFILRIGVRDESILEEMPEKYITKINRSFYGQKYLIDLEYFNGRIADKSKIRNILIGKRVFKDATEINRISKFKCFVPFIQSGVFGLGLPQIVELFLRGDFLDILNKIGMVFSRSALFLLIICRSKTYEIKIGRDIGKASKAVSDFINKD